MQPSWLLNPTQVTSQFLARLGAGSVFALAFALLLALPRFTLETLFGFFPFSAFGRKGLP